MALLIEPDFLVGLIPAINRASFAYIFPTPTTILESIMKFLIGKILFLDFLNKYSPLNLLPRGSGPKFLINVWFAGSRCVFSKAPNFLMSVYLKVQPSAKLMSQCSCLIGFFKLGEILNFPDIPRCINKEPFLFAKLRIIYFPLR